MIYKYSADFLSEVFITWPEIDLFEAIHFTNTLCDFFLHIILSVTINTTINMWHLLIQGNKLYLAFSPYI